MATTLQLPEFALRLTESFQQRVGSVNTATAYENALLIASTLINDEKSGSKPVKERGDIPKTFTLRDMMREAAAKPLFAATKEDTTITVKISDAQEAELGAIYDYCDEIASSPEEAYVLTIMCAHKMFEQYKQEAASLNFHTHSAQHGIQHRGIWLR